jgi:hypothetical protein
MKTVAAFIAAFTLFACPLAFCEHKPVAANLNDLIAAPQKFDGMVIIVQGLLVLETQSRHAMAAVLYSSEDDADGQLTKSGIVVIPSQEMERAQERINRRYINLTGTFRAVRTSRGPYVLVIRDISAFVLKGEGNI